MKKFLYAVLLAPVLYIALLAITKTDRTVELACQGTETSQVDNNPQQINSKAVRSFKFNYWEFHVYNPIARAQKGWYIYYDNTVWTEEYDQWGLRRSLSDVNNDSVWVTGYWNNYGKEDAYKRTMIKLDRITGELTSVTNDSELQRWWEFNGKCVRAVKV